MGIRDWMLRNSNVGSVARSVAKGWKALLEQNPEASPRAIAENIVAIRYFSRKETELAKSAMSQVSDTVTPLGLAWIILSNENQGEYDMLISNSEKWRQVMREEIEKTGLSA